MKEQFNKYAVLELQPGPEQGSVRMRAVEVDLYLAMDKKGRLYGEKERNDPCNLFMEHTVGNSSTYLSVRSE